MKINLRYNETSLTFVSEFILHSKKRNRETQA